MLGHMALKKKERGLAIGVGITFGVLVSWWIINLWMQSRREQQQNLPGNYDSNVTVYGKAMTYAPPEEIQEKYPKGRVLFHAEEVNATSTLPEQAAEQIWILMTQSGRYKFVRVDQAPRADANATAELSLYRGAEVFVWAQPGVDEEEIGDTLPEDQYRILGTHSQKGCYVVQFKNVTPEGLPTALRELSEISIVKKVEPCPIE